MHHTPSDAARRVFSHTWTTPGEWSSLLSDISALSDADLDAAAVEELRRRVETARDSVREVLGWSRAPLTAPYAASVVALVRRARIRLLRRALRELHDGEQQRYRGVPA